MLKIRDFVIGDYEKVISLWKEAKLPFKLLVRDKLEMIEKKIKKPSAIFLIAERDGEIIGYVFGTNDVRKG